MVNKMGWKENLLADGLVAMMVAVLDHARVARMAYWKDEKTVDN